MAKVLFLRTDDISTVMKPHYERSTELLNKSRELMDKEAALGTAFYELMKEDTAAVKQLGYCEYVDSGTRDRITAKLEANEVERKRLLAEAKVYREQATGILDWIKETF
jgi:hypothetical protein